MSSCAKILSVKSFSTKLFSSLINVTEFVVELFFFSVTGDWDQQNSTYHHEKACRVSYGSLQNLHVNEVELEGSKED